MVPTLLRVHCSYGQYILDSKNKNGGQVLVMPGNMSAALKGQSSDILFRFFTYRIWIDLGLNRNRV